MPYLYSDKQQEILSGRYLIYVLMNRRRYSVGGILPPTLRGEGHVSTAHRRHAQWPCVRCDVTLWCRNRAICFHLTDSGDSSAHSYVAPAVRAWAPPPHTCRACDVGGGPSPLSVHKVTPWTQFPSPHTHVAHSPLGNFFIFAPLLKVNTDVTQW